MTTLPVSWVISIFALLACAAMLSQPRLPDGARLCFLVALVSTALASGFAGLRLEYGPGVWVNLQPHIAALPLPWSADIAVTLVTATYTTLTASLLRHGQDRFVQVKPEGFRMFRSALVGCTFFLSLILISDSAIILAAFFAGNAGAMRFLAGTASLFVTAMLVGIIIALPLLFRRRTTAETHGFNLSLPQEEDREIIARIDSVMA